MFSGLQSSDAEDRLCAFTSNPQGVEPVPANEQRGVVLENGTIRCSHGSRCYGLWEKKADGEMHLLNQGELIGVCYSLTFDLCSVLLLLCLVTVWPRFAFRLLDSPARVSSRPLYPGNREAVLHAERQLSLLLLQPRPLQCQLHRGPAHRRHTRSETNEDGRQGGTDR